MDDSRGRQIADTFKATFQDNELFRKQSQQYLSPVTHLLRKKQQAHDIHQAMQLVKEDFNNAVVNQRLRKEELEDKETIIKGNLVKFDTFLKVK
ncbi:coiled-coil domain-containing protein 42 homolog [Engraulis encrasicolus]|uniref:coiled-coil domain-containing protein 42 homolog n=1 Tax=Engraulis encrasicolus TaxID=184585 RepID=UPI002FD23D4A